MKTITITRVKSLVACAIMSLMINLPVNAQLSSGASQRAVITQKIGWTEITVTYHRPNVNDRVIWGELVPYDMDAVITFGDGGNMPWRAGANQNTVINFTTDVKVEGQHLKASDYGVHIMIHKDESATVIFSNNSTSWGSFSYKEEEDALRAKVQTGQIPHRESLIYEFTEVQPQYAILSLEWEKMRIPMKIEVVNTPEVILSILKTELDGEKEYGWNEYRSGVNQAMQNGDSALALKWANVSIEKSKGHVDAYLDKFNILYSVLGQIEVIDEIMEKVINQENPNMRNQNIGYYMIWRLVRTRRIDKAMEVYDRYAVTWEEEWITKHGLAKIYAAKGKYKKALALENEIVDQVPDEWDLAPIIKSLEDKKDFNDYILEGQ